MTLDDAQLARLLQAVAQSDTDISRKALCQRLLQGLTMKLLGTQRFYGELLTRLPRQFDPSLPAMVGLGYSPTQGPQLLFNPAFFKATNGSLETLTAALEHTLLHLVFNHPSRYAAEWQTIPVIYGTDVVVNDNLTNLPDGAVTRQLLAFKYNVQLPSNADSNELITLLKRQLPVSSTPKGAHANGQVDQSNRVDAHTHWASFGSHHAANAVKSLLLRAWQETPDHQRGLLPGRARHALETLFQPVTWDWRQLVVDGLGRPTNLREPAYNRFNRRQPRRLELPGNRVKSQRQLIICIDESGSMTNQEVAENLGQLRRLLPRLDQPVLLVPFDAVVHTEAIVSLSAAQQVPKFRFGGGGTAFQAIFDWLQESGYRDGNATVLIMTDGHGEVAVDQHQMTTVVWGLTTKIGELSVCQPKGRTVALNRGE